MGNESVQPWGARPFVGRAQEMSLLSGAVDAAFAGRGGFLLVSGEPGIGKTRLAEELAGRVAEQGGLVAWGRCWEGGGAPAYWPWIQVLRACGSGANVGNASLEQMIADLGGASALESSTSANTNPEAIRFELFDAVTTLMQRLAQARPLLLVLDDMHAADQASLLLLRFFVRVRQQARVLVVATHRETEVRRSPALNALFGELVRDAVAVKLYGLSEADVAHFLAPTLDADLCARVAANVYRVTEGNPFFVGEVTRGFQGTGRTAAATAYDTVPIPESVRAAIRQRLTPLADDVRRALSVAALVGREFDLPILEAVLPANRAAMLDQIEEACAADLVNRVAEVSGRYSFTHALIPETLREDMPAAQRMLLHRTLGEALEARAAADEAQAGALAHHFFQCASAGAADKAVAYATRAGTFALSQFAYEQAVAYFEQALDAARFQSTTLDETPRCEMLLRLGNAQRLATDLSAMRATFRRALTVARRLHERHVGESAATLFARAALGMSRVGENGRADESLIATLEEALALLGERDSALRGDVMARLAMALYFTPQTLRRETLSRDAVEMARRLGDPQALVSALLARHFALWAPGQAQQRLALAEELIAVCGRTGDREIGIEARVWRAVDLLELGRIGDFEAQVAALDDAVTRLPRRFHRWELTLIHAMRALIAGQLEEAGQLSQQAFELGQQCEIGRAAQYLGVQTFQMRRHQGRLAELEPGLRMLVAELPALPVWRCALAQLYCLNQRQADAQRELDALAEGGFGHLPRDGNWLAAVCALAETCAELGDAPRADELYELLQASAGGVVVVAEAVAVLGPVDHFLGLLAATMTRWEDAGAHFERALQLNARLGAHLLSVYTEIAYAKALLASRQPGASAMAERLQQRAHATAQKLGLAHLADAAAWPPPAGASVATAAAAAIENTFRKEGEFWTIVFAGTVLRLKDSRGLAYLAYLLAAPQREFLAIDLVTAVHGGVDPDSIRTRRDVDHEQVLSSADTTDTILDERAKRSYRQRLQDLREELAEAQDMNDRGRAEKTQQEIESISGELSRALGLGGRDRMTASSSERARIAVTKAISLTLKALATGNPALRRYFGNTIKTGRFCSYQPDPTEDVAWLL